MMEIARQFPLAVATGVIAGAVLGVLGVVVAVRRVVWASMAVAETAVAGAVIATAVHGPPLWGAVGAALAAAGLLSIASERWRLPREAWVAVVFIGASGLAIVGASHIGPGLAEVRSRLEGDLILCSRNDLIAISAVLGPIALGIALVGRRLMYTVFDPEIAAVLRLHPRTWEAALWIVLALALATAVRAIGPSLTFADLVVPAAVGRLLAPRWQPAAFIAAIFGVLQTLGGLFISYRYDWPTNATICVVSVAGFVGIATVWTSIRFMWRRGWIPRARPPRVA